MPCFLEETIPECPACLKTFRTAQGRNAHLSMAKTCKWYKKGKNQDFYLINIPDTNTSTPEDDEATSEPDADDNTFNFNDTWPLPLFSNTNHQHPLDDIQYDEFVLLPQEDQQQATAGPGPRTQAAESSKNHNSYRALDDDDDSRHIIEVNQTAGRVLFQRSHSEASMETYDTDGDTAMEDETQEKSLYSPFESELDWKVAEWAVKHGPGQKAFNRFLAIPGVSWYCRFSSSQFLLPL